MKDRSPREVVWIALSDLFLDTELMASDLDHMERVLRAAPFTPAELDLILLDEVAPVCLPNLLQIAGVWDAFDEDWLIERIDALVAKPRRFLRLRRWMRARRLREMTPEWEMLRARLEVDA